MTFETPVGSSLEYTTAKLRQVDAAVREFPEVAYTYGTINTGSPGKNQAFLYIRYKPLKERKRSPTQMAQPLRERLAAIPGVTYSINVPGGPGGGAQKQLQISLQGPDTATLDRISQEVMARCRDSRRGRYRPQPQGRQADVQRARQTRRGLGSRRRTMLIANRCARCSPATRPASGRRPTTRTTPSWCGCRPTTAPAQDLHRIWLTAGTSPTARRAWCISGRSPTSSRHRRLADQPARPAARGPDHRQRRGPLLGRGRQRPEEDAGDIKLPPGYRFVFGGSSKDIAESAATPSRRCCWRSS